MNTDELASKIAGKLITIGIMAYAFYLLLGAVFSVIAPAVLVGVASFMREPMTFIGIAAFAYAAIRVGMWGYRH